MHIHLDDYLETAQGRIWTIKRNQYAWEQCFQDLYDEIRLNKHVHKIYILIGAQASGKTTWAELKNREEPNNIIFDAILVKRTERKRILDIAISHKIQCIAVFFNIPLSTCLSRNKMRSIDTCVNECALMNVYAAIEKPSINEGFLEIIDINE